MIEDIKKQNKWIQEEINKEWSDVLLYQRLWAERERCALVNDRNQLCNDSRPRLDRPHCSIIKEPGDCRIGNEFDWPMILGRVVVAAVTKTSGCRAEFLAAGSFPSNVEHRTLYINIFPQFTWQIRTSANKYVFLNNFVLWTFSTIFLLFNSTSNFTSVVFPDVSPLVFYVRFAFTLSFSRDLSLRV